MVNHQRDRRCWREEGLRRPLHTHKRCRVRPDTAERSAAIRPNVIQLLPEFGDGDAGLLSLGVGGRGAGVGVERIEAEGGE